MSSRPDVNSIATAHFREVMGNVRVIDAPEWGLTGEHAIHVWPATLTELQRINRKAGANNNNLELLAETLIVRARFADRTPIWQAGHRAVIMHEFDPDVVARVVAEINDDQAGGTAAGGDSGN